MLHFSDDTWSKKKLSTLLCCLKTSPDYGKYRHKPYIYTLKKIKWDTVASELGKNETGK